MTVMVLSQHRDSSSKTVRPRALCVVPDVLGTLLRRGLRFVQGRHTRNWVSKPDPIFPWTNGICPTPVRRRLTLTQAVWGKLIPTSLVLVMGIKHEAWMYSQSTSRFICNLSTKKRGWLVQYLRLFNKFRAAGTNKRVDQR